MNSKIGKLKVKGQVSRVKRHREAFSVVEALLAGSILIIITTAFIGAVIYGQESTAVAGGISHATFLAEEGLEAVKNIRDDDFNNLSDGNHGLSISSEQWVFSGNSDTVSGFVRQINISPIDSDTKQVTSTITWQETPQRTGNIILTTYLTRWREAL